MLIVGIPWCFNLRLDQQLLEAMKVKSQKPEWTSILSEVQGMYYFLCGLLLLKRANKVIRKSGRQFYYCMLIDSKSKWTVVQIHVDKFKFFMPWSLCTRALCFTCVRLSVHFHSVIWVPISQIIWNSYTRSVTIKEGQFLF